jgi:hypothetical protein
MPVRRLIGNSGFRYIIDGGLGMTDYRQFRLNVFNPPHSLPETHFEGVEDDFEDRKNKRLQLPAYGDFMRKTQNTCGTATLAGMSVAVPFVSALVGTLAVVQAMRIANRQPFHPSIVGNSTSLRGLQARLPVEGKAIVGYAQVAEFLTHCDGEVLQEREA